MKNKPSTTRVSSPARRVEAKTATKKTVKPAVAAKTKSVGVSAVKKEEIQGAFTKTFGFPVRLFWNLRLEKDNSSCAKIGTQLSFEQVRKAGKSVVYRVRRGKRNFYTSSKYLVEA